jgi:tetratricopeptide (TPR) repeat protein
MAIALPMLLIASLGTAGPRGRHSQTPGSGKASSGGVAGPDHSVLERFRAVVEQAAHFDRTGRKLEAAKQYREAVQLWPEFETGHFNLAMSLQETGHLSEAQHHFARTLELIEQSPSIVPDSTRKRHDVLSRYGRLTASLALGSGLHLAASTPGGHILSREQSRDLKLASRLLRKALRLDPMDSPSRLALGHALSARGRGLEAISHLRQSLMLSPQDPSAMVELALGLHRHGSEAIAVSSGVSAAHELQDILDRAFHAADPPRGVATSVAAEFHSQLGLKLRRELPAAARRHLQRALSLDPGHVSAGTSYYHLGTPFRPENHLLFCNLHQHVLHNTERPIATRTGAILRDNDEMSAEQRLYDQAVAQGVWRHPSQRPGYLAEAADADLGPWPVVARWPMLQRCVSLLERGFPEIRDELLQSISTVEMRQSNEQNGTDLSSSRSWGTRDLEGLTTSGEWHQHIYRRNGLPAVTGTEFASRFPHTTRIVEDVIGSTSMVRHFFSIAPT